MKTKQHFDALPESQQNILRQIYGPQFASDSKNIGRWMIDFVCELTDGETIECGKITQTLYKVKGILTPQFFNRAVAVCMSREEMFRMNFCRVDGNKMLAVVVKERRDLPQVIFRNLESIGDDDELNEALSKFMEADMRREFDIRYDCLVRLSVFHTAADEYAVLATMPSLMVTWFDFRNFIALAFGKPLSNEKFSSHDEVRVAVDAKNIADYWGRMLRNLPELPKLPGAKQSAPNAAKAKNIAVQGNKSQNAYVINIPPDILSDMKIRAKSNSLMLAAILETAWGLMLQSFNTTRDVSFCVVPPKRGNNFADDGEGLVPVRLKNDDDAIIRQIIDAMFKQLVVAQPYACADRQNIDDVLAKQGKKFDHFLSFRNLERREQNYSEIPPEPYGVTVAVNCRDLRDTNRLSVYFRCEENKVTAQFFGANNAFTAEGLEQLTDQYLLTVRLMLADWDAPLDFFAERLNVRIAAQTDENFAQSNKKDIVNYLSKISLITESDRGYIQELAKGSTVFKLFEGDRLSGEETANKLLFVAQGRIARSVETGDGWYNALDIVKDGDWINDSIFIAADDKNHLSAEILTEQALIIAIPMETVKNVIEKYPAFSFNIIRNISRQTEKYRRLWVNS